MFAPLLGLMLAAQVGSGHSARGVVRAADSGEPLVGVTVTLLQTAVRASTDSAGRYELRNLRPGAHPVRFSRVGYEPQSVEVLLGDVGDTGLDVLLRPRPTQLPRQYVLAHGAPDDDAASEPGMLADAGVRRAQQSTDPFAASRAATGGSARPESPAALHVRGGSGTETGVYLDGVPVYGAAHVGGVTDIVSPYLAERVTLHAAIPPAGPGDALAGTMAIESRSIPGRWTARAAVDWRTARALVGGPTGIGASRMLLAARSYARGGLADADASDTRSDLRELFGKFSLPVAGGELALLALRSADQLRFDGRSGAGTIVDDVVPSGDGSGAAPASAESQAIRPNTFAWRNDLTALRWARHGSQGSAAARLWRSGTSARHAWTAPEAVTGVASSFSSLGLSGAVSRPRGRCVRSTGFGIERIDAGYVARRVGGAGGDTTLSLAMGLISSAVHVEAGCALSPRWTVNAGIGGRLVSRRAPWLEPRAWAAYEASPRVRVAAGVARTSQVVQSLRSEESTVAALAAFALPIGAERGIAPVARGDQVTVEATIRPARATSVTVAAYRRWLDGLLLVAPATAQPFAVDGFASGRGDVRGASVALVRDGRRVRSSLRYTGELVSRTPVSGARYVPALAATHALSADMGYSAPLGLTLRTALAATVGRPASAVATGFAWSADGAPGSGEEFGCKDCQNNDAGGEREATPTVVELTMDGAPVSVVVEQVNEGRYSEAEISVMPPSAANSGWTPGTTIEITGTANGRAFVLPLSITGSFRETLTPPVSVTASGTPTALPVTITLPVAAWFQSNGVALDPADAAQRAQIEANARAAFQPLESSEGSRGER